MDLGHALARGLQADHIGRVRVAGRVRIAPGALIERRFALGPGRVAERLDLVLSGKTLVGMAVCQHLAGHFGVAVGAGELADRLAVMVQPQPGQALQDRLGRLGGRARAVRVLDPQQELAAAPACIEPVEQR